MLDETCPGKKKKEGEAMYRLDLKIKNKKKQRHFPIKLSTLTSLFYFREKTF